MSHHSIRSIVHTRLRARSATQSLGFTLLELVVVVTVIGIVLGYAGLRVAEAVDRRAVSGAVADAMTTFNAARQAAIMRRQPVAVMIDTAASRLQIAADGSSILSRDLRAEYGVGLASSRDSMAYDTRGVGLGLANLSVVVRRGQAVETVFVSRLGRVRR